MIAKMKKVRVLALESRRRAVTEALRELGTLHIETRDAKSPDLDGLKETESRLQRAYLSIPEAKSGDAESPRVASLQDAEEIADRVLAASEALKDAHEQLDKLQREIARVEAWGEFDPSEIAEIAEAGLNLTFAYVTADQLSRLPEDLRYLMVRKSKDKSRIILLDDPGDAELEVFRLPEQSLAELIDQRNQAEENLHSREAELASMQGEKLALFEGLKLCSVDIEFHSVQAKLDEIESLESLTYLDGYIPESNVKDLKDFVSAEGLGVIIQDPDPEEAVPTKVVNPRPIAITQPIFKFMDTTPGYREHDISFWFLIFFTLFVAMIIGDAGYGALLSIVSIVSMVIVKIRTKKIPNVLILFTVLSLGTLTWGTITGNWFGYGPIGQTPFLRQFVVPSLDAFEVVEADRVIETLLLFCFTLGMGHLLLAHFLNFLKKFRDKPRIHGFADLGWMTTLSGLYFLVLNLVISAEDYPIPDITLPLIIGGLVVVLLFDGQEGDGFFRGLGRTLNIGNLIHTFLTAISSFADIISYIRLFAVGLASLEIAKSFNLMAEGMMESGIFGLFAGILVLLIGHTLNLVMGGLSVLVHGIRLKMLEFSGHLGNEWTGFDYKPFKKL
jgi:V/A-type H+-transporting ATPase subunit I